MFFGMLWHDAGQARSWKNGGTYISKAMSRLNNALARSAPRIGGYVLTLVSRSMGGHCKKTFYYCASTRQISPKAQVRTTILNEHMTALAGPSRKWAILLPYLDFCLCGFLYHVRIYVEHRGFWYTSEWHASPYVGFFLLLGKSWQSCVSLLLISFFDLA